MNINRGVFYFKCIKIDIEFHMFLGISDLQVDPR